MTNFGFSDKVRGHFEANPNKPVHLSQLVDATGLNARKVQSVISAIRRKATTTFPIDIIEIGQVWEYRPDRAANIEVANQTDNGHVSLKETQQTYLSYEEVGKDKFGNPVVRNYHGQLFATHEL